VKNKIVYIVSLLITILISTDVYSQDNKSSELLTGNWDGVRDRLKSNGLVISPRLTLFNHNYVSGSEKINLFLTAKLNSD
tara:strand:- start:1960 stop:2199 length:240 start_codon:yes stop_codon:yes gene_type:complete